jgi:hypothetical protein
MCAGDTLPEVAGRKSVVRTRTRFAVVWRLAAPGNLMVEAVTHSAESPPHVVALHDLLGRRAEHNHIVQFYEAEDALVENVGRFLGAGLRSDEPVIVIATPEHRMAFSERLVASGVDVAAVCSSGQLTMLDARHTLSQILVDEVPEWTRFRSVIGAAIKSSRIGRADARVRAYGEMVDLLWRDG